MARDREADHRRFPTTGHAGADPASRLGRGWLSGLHRAGSLGLGVGLWVFGGLGFVNQLDFFATTGPPVLGLSSNGLLSTLSIVFGTLLVGAALRGGRFASSTSVAVGALFLVSGVVNVLVLATPYNLLSFRMSNVVFSLIAGTTLLVLGSYGRFTGRLPSDSPYRRVDGQGVTDADHGRDTDQQLPATPADVQSARELADAERAVATGGGTDRQRRLLDTVAARRDQAGRRALWRRLNR